MVLDVRLSGWKLNLIQIFTNLDCTGFIMNSMCLQGNRRWTVESLGRGVVALTKITSSFEGKVEESVKRTGIWEAMAFFVTEHFVIIAYNTLILC